MTRRRLWHHADVLARAVCLHWERFHRWDAWKSSIGDSREGFTERCEETERDDSLHFKRRWNRWKHFTADLVAISSTASARGNRRPKDPGLVWPSAVLVTQVRGGQYDKSSLISWYVKIFLHDMWWYASLLTKCQKISEAFNKICLKWSSVVLAFKANNNKFFNIMGFFYFFILKIQLNFF